MLRIKFKNCLSEGFLPLRIFQIHCVPSRLSPLPLDRKGEPEAGGCPGIASALTTSGSRARTFRFVKRNPIRSGQIGDPESDFLMVVLDNRQQKTVQVPDCYEVTLGGNFLAIKRTRMTTPRGAQRNLMRLHA